LLRKFKLVGRCFVLSDVKIQGFLPCISYLANDTGRSPKYLYLRMKFLVKTPLDWKRAVWVLLKCGKYANKMGISPSTSSTWLYKVFNVYKIHQLSKGAVRQVK